ncbi:hypothetical protein [Paenibacillus alginolyticus]|uniref:Uncharacterized protein n=1 Tax=Paenibacillus alginolyticus TaxID=59839 RepID=A0ABT4GJY8_9BACL|nr:MULTISPECIES: hypothetical protein [Paenibacillus]MCY9696510.1 hypothetical protein [Paenibacillus alginolyticus]MEC0144687.1 hypothetical protein [Paenibacillus alginolyticus]NRF94431.1 hypothetical protein [Paenibacillus frigoriresistens]
MLNEYELGKIAELRAKEMEQYFVQRDPQNKGKRISRQSSGLFNSKKQQATCCCC